MALRNAVDRWGWPAKLLHWLTALLVLFMLGLGFTMVWLVEDLGVKFRLYQLHKSVGVLVFALTLGRLAWRAVNPTPELPATLRPWERSAARATHAALYALLLVMPLTGWIMAAASPLAVPTWVFGLVRLPHPVGPNEALAEVMEAVHGILALLLVALLLLHVGGALRHHLLLGDAVLLRMLPEAWRHHAARRRAWGGLR